MPIKYYLESNCFIHLIRYIADVKYEGVPAHPVPVKPAYGPAPPPPAYGPAPIRAIPHGPVPF
jgi:hypothetical protein